MTNEEFLNNIEERFTHSETMRFPTPEEVALSAEIEAYLETILDDDIRIEFLASEIRT